MAKRKTAFLCSACGDDFPKWNGQCPSCKEWGTLSEFKTRAKGNRTLPERESKSLNDILDRDPGDRLSTGLNEVDRVLGGGLLSGSLILLGGNPGVGKSTLALHICSGLEKKALYINIEGRPQFTKKIIQNKKYTKLQGGISGCLLYTSPSPRD